MDSWVLLLLAAGAAVRGLHEVLAARQRHGRNSFADSVSEWRCDPKYAFYQGRFQDVVYMQWARSEGASP
jgi:hypothetical protein